MKKVFEIDPPSSMGPFCIGMARREIWGKDRSPIVSYYPNKFSFNRSDDFYQLGMHLHYDTSDLCCQITAFLDSDSSIKWVFRGIALNGFSMGEVKEMLDGTGVEYETNEFGYHCRGSRIEFGAYNFDDGDVPLEYVLIYTTHPRE